MSANADIARKERLNSNMQFRNYMQRNADSIRSYNLSIAVGETAARVQNTSVDYIVGPPHLYRNASTSNGPKYQQSDLKDWYLTSLKLKKNEL